MSTAKCVKRLTECGVTPLFRQQCEGRVKFLTTTEWHTRNDGKPHATIAVFDARGIFLHAACRADRLPLHRQVHAVPADDEREGCAARARATRRSASRRCPTRGSIASRRCSTRRSACPPRSSSPTSSRPAAPARPRWSTSPATRTPTRSCTSCARFAIPRCRIRPASVDPARDAQAMEDELILADLGVVERRLERMEKDLKKNKSPELDKEKDLLAQVQGRARERPAAARARPCRRGSAPAARLSAAVGQAAAGRDQPRRSGRRRGRERRARRRSAPG